MQLQPADLALDHLTVVDAAPVDLIELAHGAGFRAIGLFLHAMKELPLMPPFDLVADRQMRGTVRERAEQLGVGIDIAYPFSLGGSGDLRDFEPAMECAAELGAAFLNLLIFDRDEARRADRLAQFATLAAGFGLTPLIEFYPQSAVASLTDAVALLENLPEPGLAALNVDLLHLYRSGGTSEQVRALPQEMLAYAQICDGPLQRERSEWAVEAGSARQLPGDGAFDLAGFLDALPQPCRVSVEVPDDQACKDGLAKQLRAGRAMEATRRFCGLC
ncbi:MAG: TIM barrel protein [Sphingomonadaceae bacterium]